MKIDKLSSSSYDSYTSCQWKFFLNYILKLEDPSGPSAVLGQMCHKVCEILSRLSIQKRYKESKYWNPDYLWQICYNHFLKKNQDAVLSIKSDKMKKVCAGLKDLINSEYSPIDKDTIATEIYFNISLEDKIFQNGKDKLNKPTYYRISGIIDRVKVINDNIIEIIDYKTGTRSNYNKKDRSKKEPSDLAEMIQPCIYYLAARKLFPQYKSIIITLYFLVDGKEISLAFNDEMIPSIYRKLKDRFISVKNNDDPQRNKTWACKYLCSHGPIEDENSNCNKLWKLKNEIGLKALENQYVVLNYKKK